MIHKIFFKILRVMLVALILLLSPGSAAPVRATSPYTTWAPGPGGHLYMTQDAYTPYAEIDLPISGAQDMTIDKNGALYVADTGHARVARFENFVETASFGEGVLQSPTGVFVDDAGVVYAADAKLNQIFIFAPNGTLVRQFGRPSEPLFGKNREFLPKKIAVDKRQNLYIISEGSVDGVVQMNASGSFIGYFGANSASMSLKMILQRAFLTSEQLAQFVKNEAASPSNIAIDAQSLVYTITAGTDRSRSIQKFTVAGKNIFPEQRGSSTFRDLDVSDSGLVLAVDQTGLIYEYDLNGALLFVFGAQDQGSQRLGTLTNPTAIERYGEYIYVLDQDRDAVVAYQTTAFARLIHDGVRLYMDGFYAEAKPYFEQVLNYNGSFILSYQAIADAYYKERSYSLALANYRYAENREGYSEAYWEMRNTVLQQVLSPVLLALVGLAVVNSAGRRLEKRYRWLDPARAWLAGLRRFRLLDDFAFLFTFIRHPLDGFYYIKKKQRGSLRFAFLLYAWVIAARVLSLYVTGFIFNPYTTLAYVPIENEVITLAALFFLFNAANYLVSTISDGEGRVRDVVIGTAYSLFPYALFALPIALVSNVMSLNEAFLYHFSLDLTLFWTGLMLFLMVKEIHNYSFGETVRNVLVTLFTMGLFVLTAYILYVLFNQLFDFISAILQEVRLRG